MIDYAKYLLNVCGRRFTHLYRRHYLDSTPALPSLSALLSYIKTQTATIYGYLQTRFAGDPTSGIPSITPTQPLTFANLLPNLQKLATRKIDAGASTQIPDGISLVRLLCDTTAASAVTELIDTNTGWTMNREYNYNYGVSKLQINCKYISGIVVFNLSNSTYSNLSYLLFPYLEEMNNSILFNCNTGSDYTYNAIPNLNYISFPSLKRIVNSGFISTNRALMRYQTEGEIHCPVLESIIGNYGGDVMNTGCGYRKWYFDELEYANTTISSWSYHANQYIYIGYKTNDRSKTIYFYVQNQGVSYDVELKEGFSKPLNIARLNMTAENIVNHIIARLGMNTGTAITITLGSTNLGKLTAEQIAVANAKGYTLA